jgi:cell division protein FtsL
METITRIFHAYKQAAWRTQRQMIGIFLVALVGVTMVAAIYLSVTARTAIVGRQIQNMENEIINGQRVNADLQTQLASLTSASEMEKRALSKGYQPTEPGEIAYIAVAGYTPHNSISLAPQPQPRPPAIPPEYTETLLDWFDQQMQGMASTGGTP